jgi:prolipoprotein diacylglyceryltransferase
MAVVLALLVIGGDFYPWVLSFQRLTFLEHPSFLLSFIAYALVLYMLVWLPVSKMKEGGLPSTHLEH